MSCQASERSVEGYVSLAFVHYHAMPRVGWIFRAVDSLAWLGNSPVVFLLEKL
jgi:hypothetical protein